MYHNNELKIFDFFYSHSKRRHGVQPRRLLYFAVLTSPIKPLHQIINDITLIDLRQVAIHYKDVEMLKGLSSQLFNKLYFGAKTIEAQVVVGVEQLEKLLVGGLG